MISRWYHMTWLWGPPKSYMISGDVMMISYDMIVGTSKIIYDFRWCHDDFIWHDFGWSSPPVKVQTAWDIWKSFLFLLLLKLLSLSRPSWQETMSYMMSYDFHVKSYMTLEGASKCHIWCHMTWNQIIYDIGGRLQMSYMTSYDFIMKSCCR